MSMILEREKWSKITGFEIKVLNSKTQKYQIRFITLVLIIMVVLVVDGESMAAGYITLTRLRPLFSHFNTVFLQEHFPGRGFTVNEYDPCVDLICICFQFKLRSYSLTGNPWLPVA